MGDVLVGWGRALLGAALLIGVCWLLSTHRRRIDWRLVGMGMLLQLVIAVVLLEVPWATAFTRLVAEGFIVLLDFSVVGAKTVFGNLPENFEIGAIFAFKVLPSIIFFSAFMGVLYYLGILQKIVYGLAWVMHRTMRLSGAECLAAAANVFVGQTEAPLVIKPYVERMTRSELLCLMTGGMATIAGGVMALYILWLGGDDKAKQIDMGMHLLTASLMSAPAAIVAAKLLLPETEEMDRTLEVNRETLGVNVFDAAVLGTSQGVQLALNVGAVLIVFTALVALGNALTQNVFGRIFGLNEIVAQATGGQYPGLTLQFLASVVMAPVAWVIGVSPENMMNVGQLLGEKVITNELIAYDSMRAMLYGTPEQIRPALAAAPRDVLLATYALCGFSNFASMGIQIGGISILAPGRRSDLSKLALRALLGGTIACLLTATVAGPLLG